MNTTYTVSIENLYNQNKFVLDNGYFVEHTAEENEDVWFCHSTGTKAHTKKLDNYFHFSNALFGF